jgi:hypothetical protein
MTKTAKAAKNQAPAKHFLEAQCEVVEINGQRYEIAQLSAGVMRRSVLPLAQKASAAGAPDVDILAGMLDVCLLSLQKASIDPVKDDWEDRLTLGQAAILFDHVVRLSSRPGATPPIAEG